MSQRYVNFSDKKGMAQSFAPYLYRLISYDGLFVFERLNFRIYAPLLLGETAVVVVAPLCILLSGREEFCCLCRILLHY